MDCGIYLITAPDGEAYIARCGSDGEPEFLDYIEDGSEVQILEVCPKETIKGRWQDWLSRWNLAPDNLRYTEAYWLKLVGTQVG